MRFLHLEAATICDYVRSRELVVMKCDNPGLVPAIFVDASAIELVLKESETLWGGSLSYYLFILKDVYIGTLLLKDAVSRVENGTSENEFVLAGYPDGGLLSASGKLLPFQEGAGTANWWGFNRASWGWPEPSAS